MMRKMWKSPVCLIISKIAGLRTDRIAHHRLKVDSGITEVKRTVPPIFDQIRMLVPKSNHFYLVSRASRPKTLVYPV